MLIIMDDEEYSLDLGDKKGHFHERVAEWGQNKKNNVMMILKIFNDDDDDDDDFQW